MYCIKCGVELAESEKKCPLCGAVVFNPELPRPDGAPPYPVFTGEGVDNVNRSGLMFVLTMLFLLPIVVVLLCDWQINGAIVWSGYVVGAVLFLYVAVLLPLWFDKPNPVIFIPTDFAAAALYLLYINLATGGHWFLSFALPVCAGACAVITGAAALLRYLRRGYFFIFGGMFVLIGLYNVLIEFLLNVTFSLHEGFIWSIYPLAVCVLLGITLIVIGCSGELQKSLHKKFFI